MRLPILLVLLTATVAACGEAETEGARDATGRPEAEPSVAPPAGQADPPGAQDEPPDQERPAISLPRIAYRYGYAFRLSSDAVPRVQEQHLQMCQQLGPARCRIVDLRRSAASGDYLTASTKMQVAAQIARPFGDRLVAATGEAGGETVDRSIVGEDLSRQMIDAEARIRTREALVRRLTTLLETRSGNIQQAVEAERAINTAQEELDAARGWLAEMRTRVDMSTFELEYGSGAPLGGGISDPLRSAWGGVGNLFAQSLAALIMLVGALLPWLIVGYAAFAAVRWLRRRRANAEASAAEDPHVS